MLHIACVLLLVHVALQLGYGMRMYLKYYCVFQGFVTEAVPAVTVKSGGLSGQDIGLIVGLIVGFFVLALIIGEHAKN